MSLELYIQQKNNMSKDFQPTPMTFPTEPRLAAMVARHYDEGVLFSLAGEIYFDDELSEAEVGASVRALRELGLPADFRSVYLPCAGTLRHVVPLVGQGACEVVAVDLSHESLRRGKAHYGPRLNGELRMYHEDIRATHVFTPPDGFRHAAMLGNSFGDVTDPAGHQRFIKALGQALAPGGALVFDYVGDRYNPENPYGQESVWDETLYTNDGPVPVRDRRTRRYTAGEDGTGVLHFTCTVELAETGEVLTDHEYEKLVVPDGVLGEQFGAHGMDLIPLGSILGWSEYHKRRVEEKDDLGMMGASDHLYVAVKR